MHYYSSIYLVSFTDPQRFLQRCSSPWSLTEFIDLNNKWALDVYPIVKNVIIMLVFCSLIMISYSSVPVSKKELNNGVACFKTGMYSRFGINGINKDSGKNL